MIPPLTRSADSRPPIDADPDDVPEFDRLPAFRSRRSLPPAPPKPEPNEFGLTVDEWVVGFGLGAILVGFGIWLGVVLA